MVAVTAGKLKTRYLKIVDIDDGMAATVVDAITSYLKKSSGLDLKNVNLLEVTVLAS